MNGNNKIKVGDIVKAKFGSAVFTVTDENGKIDHISINPYGIVVRINFNDQGGFNDVYVKLIFGNAPVTIYKEENLEILYSTNLTNNELVPGTTELWGVTFKYDFDNGRSSRTLAISECSLFNSKKLADDWIKEHKDRCYDSAFPMEVCSDPKAVLIDRW